MITNDVFVELADMPTTVRSFVRANPDGSFNIVINSRLSYESRIARYDHEMRHILNGDYDHDRDESVQTVEARAHGIARTRRKARRRRRYAAALRRARKRAELREGLGIDPLAAAHERFLDPDR